MKITSSDFFGGFFTALALVMPGRTLRCDERFNEALKAAYDKFVQKAVANGLRPNFQIHLNPLHGDSEVINQGMVGAMRKDLISLDNPNFEKLRLKIDVADAEHLLPSIPGGRKIYDQLVRDFLHEYSAGTVLSR